MQSPFPGMNPYLELPSLWPDVHNRLIVAISDQIQESIVPTYRAVITPYLVIEQIDMSPRRTIIPDIGVFAQGTDAPYSSGGAAVAIAPAPCILPALMSVPTEYARIEIRTVRDHTLVTVIELLSPANKRPGYDGADAYERKRQELFQRAVHVLELDLLRGGRRPQPAHTLSSDYCLMLSRTERWPDVELWPFSVRDPIPIIPVPLRPPDAPVPLDLGSAIQETYRRARYDLEIDYGDAPPPPDLAEDDAAWLHEYLIEMGVR